MRHKFLLAAALAATLSVAASGSAQSLPDPNPETLAFGCRLTLVTATNVLGELAGKDEDGWFFPPVRTQKPGVLKDMDIHYALRVVEDPVYEYETYYAYGPPASPGESPRRVPCQRIVRQIGTARHERLVQDPQGDVVRQEKRYIYEKGGPDFWGLGRLGANGMAVYALRRAGVPADEPQVANVARRLAELVETYGPPDHTSDLAWLTAAFSVMPGEHYPELTRRLASKLADGQLVDGAGRGFWGPVCVNTRLLAAYTRRLQVLAAALSKLEADVKAASSVALERQRDQAKMQVEELLEDLRECAMQGARFHSAEDPYRIDDRNGAAPITVAGWPVFLFNQTTADLDCTLAALHGLAAAARAGCLPEATSRPGDGSKRAAAASAAARPRSGQQQSTPLPPPEKLSAVLARAANALAKAQRPDGRWTECNVFEPIHDFDTLKGFLPVPVDSKSLPLLPSPVTWASASAGLSALRCIGDGAGMEHVRAGFSDTWRHGLEARRGVMRDLAETNWMWEANAPEWAAVQRALLVLALGSEAATAEDERLSARLARQVVCAFGHANGWWHAGYGRWLESSLLRAPEALGLKPDVRPVVVPLDRAHLQWNVYGRSVSYDAFFMVNRSAGYLSALLFLADRARAPAAGVWVAAGTSGTSVALDAGLAAVSRQFGVALRTATLRPAFEYADLAAQPLVCLRAARGGAALPAPQAEALRSYLQYDGLVLVEVPASAEGESFVQEVRTALGGAAEHLADVPAIVGAPTPPVRVRALLNVAGRPNVIFLPIGPADATNGTLSVSQAGRVAAGLFATRLDRDMLQPGYALRWNGTAADLAKACTDATQALQMRDAPAPPPRAAIAVAPGTPATAPAAEPTAEPAPVDTKPKADEVW